MTASFSVEIAAISSQGRGRTGDRGANGADRQQDRGRTEHAQGFGFDEIVDADGLAFDVGKPRQRLRL